MSWFNFYIKSRPIKDFSYNPETQKSDFIVVGRETYFDKQEFEYWEKWEQRARENRGKNIKFFDDETNEEMSAAQIKQLENLIVSGENYVYIPIDDADLQMEIIPQKTKSPKKRKYKSRLPISKELRLAVYQLFDSACRACGDKTANQIHHIDGDPSNNHIRNLELLCYDCHLAIEGKVIFRTKINEED